MHAPHDSQPLQGSVPDLKVVESVPVHQLDDAMNNRVQRADCKKRVISSPSLDTHTERFPGAHAWQ